MVAMLNGSVNGGVPQTGTKTIPNVVVIIEAKAATKIIATINKASHCATKKVAIASPTKIPLNPYNPFLIASLLNPKKNERIN